MATTDMTPSRLEAFSDGVIAIIITIMVLELKVPHSDNVSVLLNMWPIFLSYMLSFLMVAVYWINHHHLFHLVRSVNSKILWSNIALLFCISLIPFFTAYMNENERNPHSVALYSGILLICACAYRLLSITINGNLKDSSLLDTAATHKNWVAMALYLCAMFLAYFHAGLALMLNFLVGCMYAFPNFYLDKKKH